MSQFSVFFQKGEEVENTEVYGAADITRTTFHLSGFLDFSVPCVAALVFSGPAVTLPTSLR